ncbi:MAG: hypothetical protein AAFV30_11500, partial [Pseudomonadota bacterium]
GFYLGTTELDGFIYGSASAAADCLKALIPFFIFAAWRNRMWSQMAASAVVWLVVTAYSLTSALGHAALNRQDTAGQRAAQAATYVNLQADLKRAQEQLSWVPQHRPVATVRSELAGMETQRAFKWSNGCTQAKTRYLRKFCGEFTGLKAELGSAEQAAKLEIRIADTQAALASTNGAGPKAADPQAQILAKLAGAVLPGVSIEDVQTSLAVFIALLLEVGSGLGMYIAFSQWRMGDRRQTVAEAPSAGHTSERTSTVADVQPAPAAKAVTAEVIEPPTEVANDNLDGVDVETVAETEKEPVVETVVAEAPAAVAEPELKEEADAAIEDDRSDVQKFIAEQTVASGGGRLASYLLHKEFERWSREQGKRPLKHNAFKRECRDSGLIVDHTKSAKGPYITFRGIALKDRSGDKNSPAFGAKAA